MENCRLALEANLQFFSSNFLLYFHFCVYLAVKSFIFFSVLCENSE